MVGLQETTDALSFDSILGACLELGGNDDGNIDDDEDETDEEEGDDGADDDEKTSERRERREPKSSLTVGIFLFLPLSHV